jgi:hypothetical protein
MGFRLKITCNGFPSTYVSDSDFNTYNVSEKVADYLTNGFPLEKIRSGEIPYSVKMDMVSYPWIDKSELRDIIKKSLDFDLGAKNKGDQKPYEIEIEAWGSKPVPEDKYRTSLGLEMLSLVETPFGKKRA